MTNRQAAIRIIKRLRQNGFEALLAGGCVRDMRLGRAASDYDVATNARPEEVIKLFKRTLKVGAKFGVVIVLIEGKQVEVATFRTETGYADGRHPTEVKFASAAEDASRRDFTINGMFYDPLEEKVIDYINGQADLKSKLIRTIGQPSERFEEDYLRMLRAVRFSTQLNFAIEAQTFSAICKNAKNITKISGERIAMELEAILVNPDRSEGVTLLAKCGLAEAIFPGLSAKQIKSAISTLEQLQQKSDFALTLACLFSGCSTEFALEKCKILKLSRSQTKHIKFLLGSRDKLLNSKMSLAELKLTASEPYFWDLYELQRAIQKARRKSIGPLVSLRKRIKALKGVELRPKPLLTGHDLIGLGATPGPALGQLAEEMYIAQLEGNLQTKPKAKKWVQKWLQKHRMIEK
ncbi:MAG: CCA tRNA nucleotidyltransferase [Planctomycetota bacterium]|nr:MAG: CCA tRNA nucleotidyltransferase [Planctomycetota bacterium]